MAMTLQESLETIVPHRGRRIAVSTMSAAMLWPGLSDTPFDFVYIPSAMGHAPGLGIGLALAQPDRGALVLNGDGCMLMNLGALVTLAECKANVALVILANAMYEVTGGQAVAGAARTDFAGLARAAGVERVYAFDNAEAWKREVAAALSGKGPTVIVLKVEGRLGQPSPKAPRPMQEQIRRLREALTEKA